MCMCGRFILLCSRTQHDIVKQLDSKTKKMKECKESLKSHIFSEELIFDLRLLRP